VPNIVDSQTTPFELAAWANIQAAQIWEMNRRLLGEIFSGHDILTDPDELDAVLDGEVNQAVEEILDRLCVLADEFGSGIAVLTDCEWNWQVGLALPSEDESPIPSVLALAAVYKVRSFLSYRDVDIEVVTPAGRFDAESFEAPTDDCAALAALMAGRPLSM
jgi:hypothetical protein